MQRMIHELKAPLQVIEHAAVLICLPDLNLEGCLDVDRETQVVSDVSGSLSVTKDSRALVEEFVHDAVLGRLFHVLEGVLGKARDESSGPGLMIASYLND